MPTPDAFFETADHLRSRLRGDEVFLASLSAERSDFVRLNRGRVRQAGSVDQQHLHLDWIDGRRQVSADLTLSGRRDLDHPRLDALIEELRTKLVGLPEDPYLLYSTEARESHTRKAGDLPRGEDAADDIVAAAGARDLVGIFASGPRYAGFASSLGHRDWFESESFNFDWSLYLHGDKAVKQGLAGTEWSRAALDSKFARADEELAVLARPERDPQPGRQRSYLAPAALLDIIEMLCWGGFGLQSHRTLTTPLLALARGEVELANGVQLSEDTEHGVAPGFQSHGFARPAQVPLIVDGRYAECLVSPRSAAEYGAEPNGAEAHETPLSLDLAGGSLATDDILRELGTGLYISNLWYLNYSDRRACRTTGMTRFATFWVEKGRIVAPLRAMRFDESVYRMLGSQLIGLTRERELLLDANTYGRRSERSARLPGALIDDFTLTL